VKETNHSKLCKGKPQYLQERNICHGTCIDGGGCEPL